MRFSSFKIEAILLTQIYFLNNMIWVMEEDIQRNCSKDEVDLTLDLGSMCLEIGTSGIIYHNVV